ncbi:2-dehydro-3-deoxygalactonokinase [Pseudoduganella sp. RAF53_2]|uniref:2-dehydro-3-deoxygalactonokinase n=1 Tax=unclassified Pseudoduganella TaxID=2637179 RepID=UPI003F9719F0
MVTPADPLPAASHATTARSLDAGVASLVRSAQLVGADWGSTGLRLFLIGADGAVLDTRASAQGSTAMNGSADTYRAALDTLAGDWLAAAPELPLVVCGMAGSKHGWHEVPYATCPAEVGNLLALAPPLPPLVIAPPAGNISAPAPAAEHAGGTRPMAIIPGLLYAPDDGTPDVMRGEETQIAGALALHPQLAAQACVVMPGTHSKWTQLRDGTVRAFATHMTGELFALLSQHSVLNRLMIASSAPSRAAFDQGVKAARDNASANLANQLFAVRTLGLTEKLPGDALADYMSGLLIGHELRAGLAWREEAGLQQAPLILIGEPALCTRYEQALAVFGIKADHNFPNTAPAGLWAMARRAGLITGANT